MKKVFALAGLLALSACPAAAQKQTAPRRVMTGLDVLEAENFAPLKGKRVGVITNQSGIDARGRWIVDLLAQAPGVDLVSVFAPEHGLTGSSDRGVVIATDTMRVGGRIIPLYTVFHDGMLANMRPKPGQLKNLDVLVFDIQSVSVRFYSYETSMAVSLEAAKRAGIGFIVLDRPDPIRGDVVQGPTLDENLDYANSTSYLPLPIRHGLTIGELALLHNDRVKHPRLTVVKMRGWKRSMWFDETGLPWTAPSPNLPDLTAAAFYPGLGNLDETNVSVGRGTPYPFGWIGAPWLDAAALARRLKSAGLEGVRFSLQDETPTRSRYAGKLCRGVRIELLDRKVMRPLRVFAYLVAALRDLHPKQFDLHWGPDRWGDTHTLLGLSSFKTLYDLGAAGEELAAALEPPPDAFLLRRKPFLLYDD